MKNAFSIFGGIVGAVVGFLATFLALELIGFGNPADPIASGLLALLVFAPVGAVAGLVLGTMIAMRWRGQTAGLMANSFRAFGALVVLVATVGGLYAWYETETATPWLNRNGATPLLLFEVRLPAGAAMPVSADDVTIELRTDQNTMPGEPKPDQFRRDGDRPVVTGEVELAFRTAYRQLAVKIKGQPDRTYRIGLAGNAPHAGELGPWEPHASGSEIRYRAKWAGRD